MKRLMVLVILAVAVFAVSAQDGLNILPEWAVVQTSPIAFFDNNGEIILGVRWVNTDCLILEIGVEEKVLAIYDESGVDLLRPVPGPLRGWEWIAIAWAFFIGLVIGGGV